jgi:hypothetical protein
MSLYLVAGQNAATDPADSSTHLPTRRPRRYPSETSDAEWQLIAPHVFQAPALYAGAECDHAREIGRPRGVPSGYDTDAPAGGEVGCGHEDRRGGG